MTINGMVVAASFNGGGVSSLAYDANNVDEVSVVVAGGMGDTDVGGPVMNLVPRTGGNTFKGQVFWNTAGNWSRGDNLDDHLRNLQTPITLGPGIIGSYDFNPSYGGPIKQRQTVVLGKLSQVLRPRRASKASSPTSTRSTRRTGTT